MIRALIVFIACIVLSSCTQRMVCPAYQSAFIYDKDELRKKFSYFANDTTPKVYTASKNRYLVAEPVSYREKIRSMQTVAMKPVPVIVPDSLSGKPSQEDSVITADLDRAARSIIEEETIPQIPQDSIEQPVEDSVYVITKDKEVRVLKYNAPDSLDYDETTGTYVRQKPEYYVKEVRYNMEQDNYMWYMRRNIVLPDVMLAKNQQEGESQSEGKRTREKKGLKGFFKNLFKKKPKETPDSLQAPKPQPDEFDFIDADTVAQSTDSPVLPENQKKRLLGRRKGDKEAKQQPAPAKQKSGAKKEDEDDGF